MMRAGIIGCGNIAWKWDKRKGPHYNTHAKSYHRNALVALTSCADIDFKNADGLAKAYPGVAPYGDYKEMLKKEPLDIVSVCTPVATHYRILKYVIENTGIKYILAEKPLTLNLKEAEEIAQIARERKVHISVNYLRRHDRTILKLIRSIRKFGLGEYMFGNFVYYGGVRENAVHIVDLLKLMGLNTRFSEFTSKGRPLKNDFSGSFLLRTDKGRPVYFNWIDKKDFASLEGNLFYKKGKIRLGDYSDVDIFKVADNDQYGNFRELKLNTRLPGTICTAMRYSVDDIVDKARARITDYKALEREISLLGCLEEMKKKVGI